MTGPQSAAENVVDGPQKRRVTGVGRLLIAVYGLLALAATGRSFVQIASKFDQAPLAYSLSALSAVVYIVATIALVRSSGRWYRVAWATISFELLGVLVVGALSILDPALFPHDSVWSVFGSGYLFIPLVLPILGMIWLARHRPDGKKARS
ncbi:MULTISPECIES: hypothetical protein [unclassified Cryobacterium]|jgi:hypothetical protein|uniref:hypothetical protein n=1 Tax=unclassified Cryobacterium TaxID=2649013 RepID=UPI002AB4A476|nr:MULTISPECIES: hypothetical protein [unclassified Cryobacterium]MDY7541000.1 hypothetical protein [Cryobacterium sp. 5B3]MEA9998420.1 hypothetical protein [Cryobacterium sp. RTS3]MEB0266967.1 hypothetical protein [Cryobacterium sp. 10I5]MEB0273881.1 hypothetical protein [Cryobacterium sp. 5B3]